MSKAKADPTSQDDVTAATPANESQIDELNEQIVKLHADLDNAKKGIERKDEELAKAVKQLNKANTQMEQYKAQAAAHEDDKNALQVRFDTLKAQMKSDDPIGKGAYEVRTVREQVILHNKRPAGTLVGYMTCIEGFDCQALVDSLHYGSTHAVKGDQYDVFAQLTGAGKAIEDAAAIENAIAEKDAQIALLTQQLADAGKDNE